MKTRLLVFPGKGESPVSGSFTSPSGDTVARKMGSSWLYSTLMIREVLDHEGAGVGREGGGAKGRQAIRRQDEHPIFM